LKGKRLLSIQKLDQVLSYLELDLKDLIQQVERDDHD
jgi:hypothetical protein